MNSLKALLNFKPNLSAFDSEGVSGFGATKYRTSPSPVAWGIWALRTSPTSSSPIGITVGFIRSIEFLRGVKCHYMDQRKGRTSVLNTRLRTVWDICTMSAAEDCMSNIYKQEQIQENCAAASATQFLLIRQPDTLLTHSFLTQTLILPKTFNYGHAYQDHGSLQIFEGNDKQCLLGSQVFSNLFPSARKRDCLVYDHLPSSSTINVSQDLQTWIKQPQWVVEGSMCGIL